MGSNAASIVRFAAERTPDAVALISGDEDGALTFRELDREACAVAAAMLARGLKPGDRVMFVADNQPALASHLFGALYAGLVIVPCSRGAARTQLAERAASTGARLVVTDPGVAVDGVDSVALGGLRSAGSIERPVGLDEDADALWLFTSGTTGTPRIARIGHASVERHAATLALRVLALGTDDTTLLVLPMSHSYGLRVGMLVPFRVGATVVTRRRFDTTEVMHDLRDRRIRMFPAVPTMLSALGRCEPIGTSDLRICLSAGAPLPNRVRVDAERVLGCRVREGYGLTEATFCTLDDDPPVPGSVGRAVPGVEVQVLDEAGAELASGAVGEVVVRGDNLMNGYVGGTPPEVVRDGWLHTGDLGRIDDNGRLFLVDRKKDLIVRSGFNVVPSVVEAALLEHPAVREAVAVGIPDEHRGEELVAVLVTIAPIDPEELVVFLAPRLARHEIPRMFGRMPSLPTGPTGKLQRRAVRAEIEAGRVTLTRTQTVG